MNKELSQIIKHWNHISPIVGEPKNKQQYSVLLKQWEELVDLVGDNEDHELIGLLDIVSYFIEKYKQQNNLLENKATGVDVLKYLMQTHNLRQIDLGELGSQSGISEILNGKRKLNIRQIRVLANRFKVNPGSFID
jgi:HTH-type transcriptional regulator/antitoxin HigA